MCILGGLGLLILLRTVPHYCGPLTQIAATKFQLAKSSLLRCRPLPLLQPLQSLFSTLSMSLGVEEKKGKYKIKWNKKYIKNARQIENKNMKNKLLYIKENIIQV